MWKCALLKKAENLPQDFKLIFSGTLEKTSQHNSMTKLFCALFNYENEGTLVEIVDLKICSSLKLNGV